MRVPATSANLGPGFDALGLALTLYDELTLRTSPVPGLRIEAYGDVPTDETNLVVQSARAAFAAVGEQPSGLELAYTARIPHARGLGSSAAAICAGVTAALALNGIHDRSLALEIAFSIERHPDNIAAAIYGGLTVSWVESPYKIPGNTAGGTDKARAVRLVPAAEIVPIAFIPEERTSTSASRGTLPATVSHHDAAYNAGRAALLVAALTSSPRELLTATEDRLHQQYRLPRLPEGAALIDRLRAAGVPAVLSGSGPTVLALCRDAAEVAIAKGLADVDGAGMGYVPHELGVDLDGTTCSVSAPAHEPAGL